MNSFQWMIQRYTSAHIALSRDELRRLEQRCNEIVAVHRFRMLSITVLAVVTTVLVVILFPRMIGTAIGAATGWPERWCIAGSAIILAVAMASGWMFIFTQVYVRPLRSALREFGHEVCLRCGYSLRGLPDTTDRCPECGLQRLSARDESSARRSLP